ncbi:MAG TPA: tripartite tricarboxylate transporter TctB family protein [Desulfobulbaceae bacterium]|nr:tripartite tricarboxylate transporter TctB family protein [Desulfobulbaceae bacterium]
MAREKVGALFMLCFSIAYGLLATRIPLSFLAEQQVFTSRTMPYGLAVAGTLLSFLMLVLPTRDPEGGQTLTEHTRGMAWGRAIALIVLMVVYGLTMKWLGFILASIFFLLAGFYIMGERRIKNMLIASIPLVFVLWYIMSKLLGMYIAPGELFYQLGII